MQQLLTHQRSQRKRRVLHNSYVDIDGVTEQPGPNYQNWIEITQHKLQERESKLLQVIKDKIESTVNDALININLSTSRSYPESFIISDGIMKETLLVLTNSINDWNGVNLSRLKKPITLFRDYYKVGKKSWDRRKTKMFGSALWVNVFKQIHHFVWMNRCTLIQILQALFSATIKYNHTKAQSLISGTIIYESREFQTYFMTLDHSFRIREWSSEMDKKHIAKSLQEMMRSHLSVLLDELQLSMSVVNSSGGPIDMREMDDYDSKAQHSAQHTQQQHVQNFVLNPSVLSGGGGSGGMCMEQMEIDGTNAYTHQPPPQNGSNDMRMMDAQQNNFRNYYSNQYPAPLPPPVVNPTVHCCCCNCNHNDERFMNSNLMTDTNSNSNIINNNNSQSLSGYSSSAFHAAFTQGSRSQSLSNPSIATVTPPIANVNNHNDMFYEDDTLNEMNSRSFEMNDYDFYTRPLPAATWL